MIKVICSGKLKEQYLIKLVEELRTAIEEDRLLEYKEEFINKYKGN